jgi:hypothetical protein
MLKQKDKYTEPITITFPKMVARVYFPILESQEREKRMKKIHRATANLIEGVTK